MAKRRHRCLLTRGFMYSFQIMVRQCSGVESMANPLRSVLIKQPAFRRGPYSAAFTFTSGQNENTVVALTLPRGWLAVKGPDAT